MVRAKAERSRRPGLMKMEVAAMDFALLKVAVYVMGMISVAVLAFVGLRIALKEGGWTTTGYVTALGAVFVELARIGLRA